MQLIIEISLFLHCSPYIIVWYSLLLMVTKTECDYHARKPLRKWGLFYFYQHFYQHLSTFKRLFRSNLLIGLYYHLRRLLIICQVLQAFCVTTLKLYFGGNRGCYSTLWWKFQTYPNGVTPF